MTGVPALSPTDHLEATTAEPAHLRRCRPALGTYVKISLRSHLDQRALLEHSQTAFAEIERIERLMSFHDPHSELSLLNREAHLHPIAISSQMLEVLQLALELGELSDGAFDVTVGSVLVENGVLPCHHPLEDRPTEDHQASYRDIELGEGQVFFKRPLRLDLGGIAKGFAVDQAFSLLPAKLEAKIEAGGDLRLRPWQHENLGVRIPGAGGRESQGLLALPMADASVATSAAYFTDGQPAIIDPARRSPIKDWRSLSVFAPTCMVADALTKLAFLLPADHTVWARFAAQVLEVDSAGTATWLVRRQLQS